MSKYLPKESGDGSGVPDRKEIAEICQRRNIAEPCWVLKASEEDYQQLRAFALATDKDFRRTIMGGMRLQKAG